MAPRLRVNDLAGPLGEANLAAVGQSAIADPRRTAGLRVDVRDVRDIDRQFPIDDAAGVARARLGVALDHADALDDDAILRRQHPLHLAALALVAAGDDHDLVTLLDLEFRHGSEHLGRKRDDLHELARAQFARHRSEDARSDRLALLVDQHRRVAVEADRRAVDAADFLRRAYDHRLMHVAFLDRAARDRLLDRHHDYIADGRVFALGAPQHLDALDAPGAGIVGHVEIRLHLDHGAYSFPAAASATGCFARRRLGRSACAARAGTA